MTEYETTSRLGAQYAANATRFIKGTWQSPPTRWILLLGCIVCLTGWVFRIVPVEPVWGPIGTWFGGTATALGLVFAGLQIKHAYRQSAEEQRRREEDASNQREAMARAVSVSSSLTQSEEGDWSVKYTVVNGADYPIDHVVLFLHDHGQWGNPEIGGQPIPREIVIGSMYQKQRIEDSEEVEGDCDVPFALLTGMGELRFTDTWNQSWSRSPGGIDKLNAPPRMC